MVELAERDESPTLLACADLSLPTTKCCSLLDFKRFVLWLEQPPAPLIPVLSAPEPFELRASVRRPFRLLSQQSPILALHSLTLLAFVFDSMLTSRNEDHSRPPFR